MLPIHCPLIHNISKYRVSPFERFPHCYAPMHEPIAQEIPHHSALHVLYVADFATLIGGFDKSTQNNESLIMRANAESATRLG